MSDILQIKAITAPWQGMNYSVTWDGRGFIAKPNGIKAIWDCAHKACTKGWRVGFSFSEMAVSIDGSILYSKELQSTDYLMHLVQKHGGITGVAFTYIEEAETFVDELDKIIMWKLLKREFDE